MSEPVARTVKDFCRAYGVSRPTVYRLLAAGKLKAVKVSSTKTLIPEESAKAWFGSLAPTHVLRHADARDCVKQEETARNTRTPQSINKSKELRQRENT
jgi:excisionase family DNA binding protein